jgi:5,10-methylenetetrahydromethanopterin reductase
MGVNDVAGKSPIGLVLGSAVAPEDLRSAASTAEQLGFGELWLAEDYFFTGGVSAAAAALSATDRIPVGLGIMSAVTRHPALMAMEIATLSRMFPGRVWPGIGLGVPGWLRQMGLLPASPLQAMRECIVAVSRLLRGEELSTLDGMFLFDRVRLTYVPDEPVPIHVGVIGPRMLQLAGALADGTVLSILSSPQYLQWARSQIMLGAQEAGRDGTDHRISAFALYSVDEDARRAREAVRGPMAFYLSTGTNSLTDSYGISQELGDMISRGGVDTVEREMPSKWVDDLAVAGTPADCSRQLQVLIDAGADAIALFPMPSGDARRVIELTARGVLPRLS